MIKQKTNKLVLIEFVCGKKKDNFGDVHLTTFTTQSPPSILLSSLDKKWIYSCYYNEFYALQVFFIVLRLEQSERPYQRWNRSGFSRPDPTGKFQNHRRLTGRPTGRLTGPVDLFFKESFCSLFNVSDENFSKGGAWVRC